MFRRRRSQSNEGEGVEGDVRNNSPQSSRRGLVVPERSIQRGQGLSAFACALDECLFIATINHFYPIY